ncbi:hypothetical protein K402DRAFT_393799 [Aulographum hederae CBS 113979]|uniref:DNA repair and recombination protein RAD26 n=1 Tax=Aulographum hederae CBS 113979 TaxID=1176131 RepID=A0A6G1GZS4_9PEZI|nr:hypothetical protein K402DRAFT_393799 [Aulographum hederae CBS 113979]
MKFKPFKPLSISRPAPVPIQHNPDEDDIHPAAKRRRVSKDQDEDDEPARTTKDAAKVCTSSASEHTKASDTKPAFRTPLHPVVNNPPNNNVKEQQEAAATGQAEGYYTCLWRKYTTKKNKTWDGDGVLSVYNGYARLQDITGRDMGKTACKTALWSEDMISLGGKEVEIDQPISKKDFLAGKPFLRGEVAVVKTESVEKPKAVTNEQSNTERLTSEKADKLGLKNKQKSAKIESRQVDNVNGPLAPKSQAVGGKFKSPFPVSSTTNSKIARVPSDLPQPRHDPTAEGAIVMKRPDQAPKGKHIVDVVVDPLLTKSLREHQRQGVKFLYECVMGMRSFEGQGAILADEMGLGKTLQTIALLWTLMKQNPIAEDPPVVKKALIVCPVTLINNWKKEFRKWLGNERIGVLVVDGDKRARLTDFTKGKSYNVMVVGYEKLRSIQDELKKGAGVDIVIMDEGHRLKTAKNQAATAIRNLPTNRRVILSGTPIQNDLVELFNMVDLINPGLLGKLNSFKRNFEGPMLKGRQPGANAKDVEIGEARSEELGELTKQFILRRTADLLSKYLPPKVEYVVLCRPTNAQAAVYRSVLSSPAFGAVLGSPEASLQLINVLKKVCNSPSLLSKKNADKLSKDETSIPSNSKVSALLDDIPSKLLADRAASAKLHVLDSLLHRLRTTTSEKVVLVSNYTSTLDILAQLLASLNYSYLRLDGSTPAKKRQDLVDTFNRTPAEKHFVFLLSAKAGGVGLNLIGASRLVLFDVDWNPATDLQAMGRIHRDGQKRPCWIYRFLLQGALEEKIFQRQIMKRGLADKVVDGKASAQGFSKEELKDLFSFDEKLACGTHELLNCPCEGKGNVLEIDAEDVDGRCESGCDDTDDELPDFATLIKASQLDMEAQEQKGKEKEGRRIEKARGGKKEMLELMKYAHFDAALFQDNGQAVQSKAEEAIVVSDDESDDDEILGQAEGEAAETYADGSMKKSKNGSKEKVKAKANALPTKLDLLVEDDVLLDCLKEAGSRIGFVFAKNGA